MLIPKINNILKDAEQEIDKVKTKRARLLKENTKEIERAISQRKVLVELREYLLELGFLG
jgi:hypothetical protein